MSQMILVMDFGGQYNQLIARKVRECNVFCEVVSYQKTADEVKALDPVGIIFTGGPNSVYADNAPMCDPEIFSLGIPILGICYGHQVIAQALGGVVASGVTGEFGKTLTFTSKDSALFRDFPAQSQTWMSHNDGVSEVPKGFKITAHTDNCPIAAMENDEKKIYGVQFHPEVTHTEYGFQLIKNFLYDVCGCTGDWTMGDYAVSAVKELKEKIGNSRVLLALSGGVDSAVAASMLSKAVGKQLTCIFVDHGLMRKNEGDEIEEYFGRLDMNFIRVNAEDQFLGKLAGVTEPESKRKIIGEEFIKVFEKEAKKIGTVDYFAQGTIYPDIVESGIGDSAVIKSHHNVGGLPDHVDFKEIIEPLKYLFKDEVRKLGLALGLPTALVWRQPFPGPGLSIRIIGEVTKDRIALLQDADFIFRQEISNANLQDPASQYFAVLTDIRSVGVMGDERTYDYTLALRAVTTDDFMTADFAKLPYELLGRISTRIINEVPHINRIVYDITTKPPATIEWE